MKLDTLIKVVSAQLAHPIPVFKRTEVVAILYRLKLLETMAGAVCEASFQVDRGPVNDIRTKNLSLSLNQAVAQWHASEKEEG